MKQNFIIVTHIAIYFVDSGNFTDNVCIQQYHPYGGIKIASNYIFCHKNLLKRKLFITRLVKFSNITNIKIIKYNITYAHNNSINR